MRHYRFLILLGLILAAATHAGAQPAAPPPPSDAVKSMLGGWELSNADRDLTCIITFRLDMAGQARALDLGKDCTATFPIIKDVAAWTIDNEALRLLDGKGKQLIAFNEVENGMFESEHSSETLYFLQPVAAAEGHEHTPDTMFGTWVFARANGKPICQMTLLQEAADTDSFALQIKPGCDPFIANFAPRAWRMDRGQFVLLSSRSDPWRFEENETNTWHRIPEVRQPLVMVKQ